MGLWIHCCKRPNYNFGILQSNVATALKWGGRNYSRVCQVSSRLSELKVINIAQCFKLFKKWHIFRHGTLGYHCAVSCLYSYHMRVHSDMLAACTPNTDLQQCPLIISRFSRNFDAKIFSAAPSTFSMFST